MNNYSLAIDRAEILADPTPCTLARKMGYPTPWHVRSWWRDASDDEKYVLIMAARRHFKSRSFSVVYPIYRLLQDPNTQILLVGETHDAVTKWVREIIQHIEHPNGLLSFLKPESPIRWGTNEFIVARSSMSGEASVRAVGVGGTMLGSGADLIIGDDLISRDNSATMDKRIKIMDWFANVLGPILEDQGGVMRVIGTPWYEDDLYAHLVASEIWKVIKYPAISEAYPGGVLWPDKHDMADLMEKKKFIGSTAFTKQYLLDLSLVEGGMIHRDWIRYHTTLPDVPLIWRIGVDPSLGKTETAHYTGIVVDAKDKATGHHYIQDMDAGRWEGQARLNAISRMYHKYPDAHIVVEDTTMSSDFIGMLTRDTDLPVKPISPKGQDKVSRANAITPTMERGDMSFHERLRNSLLISQLIEFPDGSYDDLVDAWVYSVKSANETTRFFGFAKM